MSHSAIILVGGSPPHCGDVDTGTSGTFAKECRLKVPTVRDDCLPFLRASNGSSTTWWLDVQNQRFFICFSTINIHHIVGDTSPYVIWKTIFPFLLVSRLYLIRLLALLLIVAYSCSFLLNVVVFSVGVYYPQLSHETYSYPISKN